MNMKIGQRLQSIREDRKMSQSEFADILSISQSAYSRLERGETHVSYDEIMRYAEILNVPIYELLPETSVFQMSNSGQGAAGITFGNCIFNIGTDAAISALQEENKALAEKNKELENKIHLLEKQFEKPDKKG